MALKGLSNPKSDHYSERDYEADVEQASASRKRVMMVEERVRVRPNVPSHESVVHPVHH